LQAPKKTSLDFLAAAIELELDSDFAAAELDYYKKNWQAVCVNNFLNHLENVLKRSALASGEPVTDLPSLTNALKISGLSDNAINKICDGIEPGCLNVFMHKRPETIVYTYFSTGHLEQRVRTLFSVSSI
jgi:hypothetical protein